MVNNIFLKTNLAGLIRALLLFLYRNGANSLEGFVVNYCNNSSRLKARLRQNWSHLQPQSHLQQNSRHLKAKTADALRQKLFYGKNGKFGFNLFLIYIIILTPKDTFYGKNGSHLRQKRPHRKVKMAKLCFNFLLFYIFIWTSVDTFYGKNGKVIYSKNNRYLTARLPQNWHLHTSRQKRRTPYSINYFILLIWFHFCF